MIISIMKVNIGLCLVGVVIGEFIGARNGLGYLIIYGSQVFQLDLVILSILILCLMAMLLYGGVTAAEKLLSQETARLGKWIRTGGIGAAGMEVLFFPPGIPFVFSMTCFGASDNCSSAFPLYLLLFALCKLTFCKR